MKSKTYPKILQLIMLLLFSIVFISSKGQDVTAPSVPQNLHIVALDHYHVTIAWDASTDNAGGSGMKGYPVWTCQTVWGGSDKYSTTNSFTINFNAAYYALPGSYFQLAAQAEDNAGNISALSAGVRVDIPPAPIVPDTEAPTVPTNLVGTATASSINLSWAASTDNVGVVAYEIYAYPGGILPSPLPPPTIYISTATTYSISQTLTGIMTYKVRAKDAAGNYSGYSNTITVQPPVIADIIPPSVPQNLHIVALDHYHVTIAWDASTDNAGGSGMKGYPVWTCQTVWGGSDKYSTTNSFTINFDASHYALPGAYFQLAAQAEDNAGNKSALSAGVRVDIPPAPVVPDTEVPTVPTNLVGTATVSSINLSWAASTDNVGVMAYEIYAYPGGILPSPLPPPTIYITTATTYTISQTLTGTMTYKVRAKDAAGNYSGYSNTITVQPPVVVDIIAPSIPQNVHIVSLDHYHVTVAWDFSTDNAGGSGMKGYPIWTCQTVWGGSDKYSTTNSFTINFDATHYALPGAYFQLAAQAEDNAGNKSALSASVVVNIPPAPAATNFTASPTTTEAGTAINFTFVGAVIPNNTFTAWYWYFGDGTTSSLMNPSHVYTQPGIYTVSLAATKSIGGVDSIVKQNYITITAPTNNINFTVSPPTATVGTAILFTSTGIGNNTVVSYLWSFGDGSLSTQQNPLHTYTQQGLYTVQLTVTFSNGFVQTVVKNNVVTVTNAIDVQAPSAPTNLRIVSLTPQRVIFTWDASTDNVGVVRYMKSTCQTICGGIDDSTTTNTYSINFTQAWYDLPGRYFKIAMAAKDAAGNLSGFSNYLRVDIPLDSSLMKPDLSARLELAPGQTLFTPVRPIFNLIIYNRGTKNVSNAHLTYKIFKDNGAGFQLTTTEYFIIVAGELKVGDSTIKELHDEAFFYETPTSFTKRVEINYADASGRAIEESNYTNNTSNELLVNIINPIANNQRPDLIVESIKTAEYDAIEGSEIKGFIVVKNIGQTPLPAGVNYWISIGMYSSFSNSHQGFFQKNIINSAPLLPNQTTTIPFVLYDAFLYSTNVLANPKMIGFVDARAAVDYNNQIQETNEFNNEKTVSKIMYFVADLAIPKPDLIVSRDLIQHVGSSATEVHIGDSIHATFFIKNVGATHVENGFVTVKLIYGGSSYFYYTLFIGNLAVGEEVPVKFNVVALANFNAFVFTIDTNNDLYESNENNNVYVKQYIMPKTAVAVHISNFLNGDNLYVTLPNEIDNNSLVTLRDMRGTILGSYNYTGNKTFSWDVGHVVMGAYIITIQINHQPFSQQIMLVK